MAQKHAAVFLHLRGWKSKTKMQAGLLSPEASPPVRQMAAVLLCLQRAFALCVVPVSSSLKDTRHVGWRRQWHPTPVLLPGKSHEWRSMVAAVHGVAKSRTRLSDFTFTFHFHALEKEMAAHSSVLAWRIPGTGEPGGLLSMGSHRVGHDWSDLAAAAAAKD